MAMPRAYSLSGTVLAGRYQVGGPLAERQLSYLGTDKRDGSLVTITVSHSPVRDPAALARLQRFEHPHLSRMRSSDIDTGDQFVVSDPFDGFFLDEELRAHALAAARILAIAIAVFDAVAALHAADLCHGAVDLRAVFVGSPAGIDDTDVDAVKLAVTQLALGQPPGTIAADLAGCVAILRSLGEVEPIAPLRDLIAAAATMSSVAELVAACRVTLAALSPAERAAACNRPPPPPPVKPRSMPMPTNWSPPPPPRAFAYGTRRATPPPRAIVVPKSFDIDGRTILGAMIAIAIIGLMLVVIFG